MFGKKRTNIGYRFIYALLIYFSFFHICYASNEILNNKSVLFDGDSIAYGALNDTEKNKCLNTKCPNGNYSYANYIETTYNMKVDNVAVSGSGFIGPQGTDTAKYKLINHLDSSVTNKKYDYIILEGGINDIRYLPELNSNYTLQQHLDAIKEYLNKVIVTWPNAKIGFIIVPKVSPHTQLNWPQYEEKYFEELKKILKDFDIPYIDFLGDSKYNSVLDMSNVANTYDYLHPTVVGHEKWASYIANFMANLEQYEYTVSFDANGGTTNINTINVKSGKEIGTLPVATRSNFIFRGWYTSKTGGVQLLSNTIITSNLTYYAHWDCPTGSKEVGNSCVKYSCETVDNIFYDKDGNVVSEDDYLKLCVSKYNSSSELPPTPDKDETPEENPKTGAFVSILSMMVLLIIGLVFIVIIKQKKKKML